MTKKLLVVDDEASVLFTLIANLELEGFEVVGAENAAAALAVLERGKFDLVLSDVRMPGMHGVDLYRRIRRVDPDVPVVLMTAFALEGLVEDALREGAFAVLPKPLPVDVLLKLIARALTHPVILVVDDLTELADSTVAALQAIGVPARAVYGGDSALEALREGPVDVCVVDLVMPGRDGAATIAAIVRERPHVVCIAISGQDVPELIRRIAASSYAVLRKPVPPEQLLLTVARARSTPALIAREGAS